MAITKRASDSGKRGNKTSDRCEDTYLIRVYLGRHPITKKRIELNVTFRGTFEEAQEREQELKESKEDGNLSMSSLMTLNEVFEDFIESSRHRLEQSTLHTYKTEYRIYVAPHIGTTPICRVKRSDIQGLFNFMLDQKEALR